MHYLKMLRDLFYVYDLYGKNGERISREMVIYVLGIISSALVGFGVLPVEITDAEKAAWAVGIMSFIGFVARLSSKGGTTKLLPSRDPSMGKQPSSVIDGDD